MLSEKESQIAENLAVVEEHLQNDLMDKLVETAFHDGNGSDEKADLVKRSDVEDFAIKKPADDEDSISLKSASSDQCTNTVPTKGELLKQDTLVDLLPEIDDIFQSDEKSAISNKETAFESLKNDKVLESCEHNNEIEAEVDDELESNDFDSFSEQKASQEPKTFSDEVVDSIFTYGVNARFHTIINWTFLSLQITLMILFYLSNFNIHVGCMNAISVFLWFVANMPPQDLKVSDAKKNE